MITEKKLTEKDLNNIEKDYLNKIRKAIDSATSNYIEVNYDIPRNVIKILQTEHYSVTYKGHHGGFCNNLKNYTISW